MSEDPNASGKSRPGRSFGWVIADTGGVAVLSLLAMLVMARLVGPEDFGIAALVIGLVQIANLYAEGLLHDALVQHPDANDLRFRQAWWFGLIVGMAMFAVALVGAMAFSGTRFATIGWCLAGAALSLPFSGLIGVGNARLRRDFHFRTVAISSVVAKLVSSVIGIAIALAGGGVLALIGQFVIAAMLNLIVQTSQSRWVPRPIFTFRELRPLWPFALPYALMHTLVGGRIQAYVSLVAATMGLSAAGFISVAFRLTLTPQVMLVTAITNFGLPMLAPHQNDPAELHRQFHRLSALISIGGVAIFLGIAMVASPLVHTMLGQEWLPSILPLQIFAVAAALYLLRVSSSILLRALGHVRFAFANAIAHLVITLGGLVIFHPATPEGAALFWLLPAIPLVPATLYVVQRWVGIGLRDQLAGIGPAVLAGAGLVAVILILRVLLAAAPDVVQLVAEVAVGGLVYLLIALVTSTEGRALAVKMLRRPARA